MICAIWYLDDGKPLADRPCVAFCHGHGCMSFLSFLNFHHVSMHNTLPASILASFNYAVPTLVPAGYAVIGFDFSGCGLSEGEWSTLGWKEPSELHAILEYCRDNFGFSSFGMLSITSLSICFHSRSLGS